MTRVFFFSVLCWCDADSHSMDLFILFIRVILPSTLTCFLPCKPTVWSDSLSPRQSEALSLLPLPHYSPCFVCTHVCLSAVLANTWICLYVNNILILSASFRSLISLTLLLKSSSLSTSPPQLAPLLLIQSPLFFIPPLSALWVFFPLLVPLHAL